MPADGGSGLVPCVLQEGGGLWVRLVRAWRRECCTAARASSPSLGPRPCFVLRPMSNPWTLTLFALPGAVPRKPGAAQALRDEPAAGGQRGWVVGGDAAAGMQSA